MCFQFYVYLREIPVYLSNKFIIAKVSAIVKRNSVAAGNPRWILRAVCEHDRKFYFLDWPITPEDLSKEAALRNQQGGA